MPNRCRWALFAALVALLSACREAPVFTTPRLLGGREVPAATLETGRRAYAVYCRNCHGARGDGDGPVGWNMTPRPRDFTKGIFKFASVRAGELPTDADLRRTIRRGLPGTGMLAWQVPEEDLQPIIEYVKTFSPAWSERVAGEPVPITPDPWWGREKEAIARGRLVYHGRARCQACHPAYAPPGEILAAVRSFSGPDAVAPRRADPERPTTGESAFGPLAATDFRQNRLRAGSAPEDLYRTIACGVGGTAMPTWKGGLSESDLWALVHFVRSLLPEAWR